MITLIVSILVLGAGTYVFRAAGPLLRKRWTPSPALQRTLEVASIILLAAVAMRAGTFQDGAPAGVPLISGCLAAVVFSWCRAPLLVTVGAAIAVTAGLRFGGL